MLNLLGGNDLQARVLSLAFCHFITAPCALSRGRTRLNCYSLQVDFTA